MFTKIMVPIDLGHLDDLSQALAVAAQMAKSHNAEVIYVGVYGNVPTEAVPPAQEYSAKLEGVRGQAGGRPWNHNDINSRVQP